MTARTTVSTPLTFQEARDTVAATQGWDPAPWGWENDEVYVIAYDYGNDPIPSGEPDLLVVKRTGQLRWVSDLSASLSVDDLRPVGTHPAGKSLCAPLSVHCESS